MPTFKKRAEMAKTSYSPIPSYWFVAVALGWATLVFVLHLHFSRRIPDGPVLYFHKIISELTLGRNFANFWFGHILRTSGCLLFFVGAGSIGRYALQWFLRNREDDGTGPLNAVLSLGLGLGILGYAAFAMIALGIIQKPVIISCYVLIGGVALKQLFQSVGMSWNATHKNPTVSLTWGEKLIIYFIAGALFFSFLGSTVPEISYDALVYHLAVPQAYVYSGRMIELPYNHYSYLPLFTSMLYFWGLALDGMYSAKLINFFLGLSIMIGLYRWGVVLKNRAVGLFACSIFLGTPLVIYLFWMSNSDFCVSFFLLLMLIGVWRWAQDAEKNSRMLYLAGLFGGVALATKYTAAFGISILTPIILWINWNNRRGGWLREFCLYGTLLLLPLIPWWTRNYIYKGNPVFPYLVTALGPPSSDLDLVNSWHSETKDRSSGPQVLELLEKFWKDAMAGFADAPYYYVGPLFLGFFLLVLGGFKVPWVKWGTIYCVLSIVLGLSQTHITRLLIPYYVPLALIIALVAISLPSKPICRAWMFSLLLSISISNSYEMSGLFLLTSMRGLRIATGVLTPSEYLKQPHSSIYTDPPYAAFEFIGKMNLNPGEKVLVLGESRVFYCPISPIANASHDVPVTFSWANDSRDPAELYMKLKARNVSVFLSNNTASRRNDSPKYINARGVSMIASMLDIYFNKIYEDQWTIVYQRKI